MITNERSIGRSIATAGSHLTSHLLLPTGFTTFLLTFLIFWIAILCDSSPVANASEQSHVPHIGFYELKLSKRDPSSTLLNIQGRLVAEWSHSCHGWSSKQRMVLIMKDLSGKKINSQVNTNTFESLDGKIYKFFSK